MPSKPINIQNLELSLPHKICFEEFNCQIPYGSRIAIIGRNGVGKSTLLNMIAEILERQGLVYGYVPQTIDSYHDLSGGERLNASTTEALSIDPDVLLLDEPTNHLDIRNKNSLMRMLMGYRGTLIIVSHDKELLRSIDTLWHIDNGKIYIFSGSYDDYIREIKLKRASIENEMELLNRQKKGMHDKLMQEQKRAAKSRAKGAKSIDQSKWPTIVSKSKALNAQATSGLKKLAIDHKKQRLIDELDNLRPPEIITPKFSIDSSDIGDRTLVQISGGSAYYSPDNPVLLDINLTISNSDRMAITGDNGSGKSTLIKAILGYEEVHKSGDWFVIKKEDIGYLDQHYSTLDPAKSVFETISELVPHWSRAEIRKHLNLFLFRKNEEANALVGRLSGGEKARLSLAQIAAKTPKLLILDEITNNLDLETKDHVVEVLRGYPGAMIVISHDVDFLKEIGVDDYYST
ncbi:MAG: ATP-binding cassette domain-containing protein [Pseudomonadota bacterium]